MYCFCVAFDCELERKTKIKKIYDTIIINFEKRIHFYQLTL